MTDNRQTEAQSLRGQGAERKDGAARIYCVEFREPPVADSPDTRFFFHSLAAIYDVFTAEQVGCGVHNLWNVGVPQGKEYENAKCRVTQEVIHRKRQAKPHRQPTSGERKPS